MRHVIIAEVRQISCTAGGYIGELGFYELDG
jgi:hypothetical protein